MTNEIIDTTNKLIEPEAISPSDDEIIRQLSENLQDITPKDIDAMCDAMDEAKKKSEKIESVLTEMNRTNIEEKINNLNGEEFIELMGILGIGT